MKIFFRYLAVFSLIFITGNVFAAPKTPYKIYNESIQTTLSSHGRGLLRGMGPSTDIAVINYTDTVIQVVAPTYNLLNPRTSARIKNDTYGGTTEIRLTNQAGQVFFDQWVNPFATISVYLNGTYTVNVSN